MVKATAYMSARTYFRIFDQIEPLLNDGILKVVTLDDGHPMYSKVGPGEVYLIATGDGTKEDLLDIQTFIATREEKPRPEPDPNSYAYVYMTSQGKTYTKYNQNRAEKVDVTVGMDFARMCQDIEDVKSQVPKFIPGETKSRKFPLPKKGWRK